MKNTRNKIMMVQNMKVDCQPQCTNSENRYAKGGLEGLELACGQDWEQHLGLVLEQGNSWCLQPTKSSHSNGSQKLQVMAAKIWTWRWRLPARVALKSGIVVIDVDVDLEVGPRWTASSYGFRPLSLIQPGMKQRKGKKRGERDREGEKDNTEDRGGTHSGPHARQGLTQTQINISFIHKS